MTTKKKQYLVSETQDAIDAYMFVIVTRDGAREVLRDVCREYVDGVYDELNEDEFEMYLNEIEMLFDELALSESLISEKILRQ